MKDGKTYKKTVFPNGLRVISEKMDGVFTLSLGLWVNKGSRDEPEHFSGISHLIEHLVFKGTKKRSIQDIARSMDRCGSSFNAFTSKEYTCFYCKILSENVENAMDVLSDIYTNPLFLEGDLQREKKVVFQEISMVEDTPDDYIYELLYQNMFKEHPISRPILGRPETIENIKRSDVFQFACENYRACNTIFTVAGCMEHDEVVKLAEKHLKNLNGGTSTKNEGVYKISPQRLNIYRKKLEQSHICLGMNGLKYTDKDRFTLSLLSGIFGEGNSSRLVQEVREKRGWVYDIYTYTSSYRDIGSFGIYLATSHNRVRDVLEVVYDEIERIREQGVSEEELEIVKERLHTSLLISFENSDMRMIRLGKNEIYFGENIPLSSVINSIKSVSDRDIYEVSKRIMNKNSFCLTILGECEEKDIPNEFNKSDLRVISNSVVNTSFPFANY